MYGIITIPGTTKTLSKESATKLLGLLAVGVGVYFVGRKYLS
jgi:hypothetical protein